MDIVKAKENNPIAWVKHHDGDEYKIKWISIYHLKDLKDDTFLAENLIDWRGVESDGKPIKCNMQNKKAFAATWTGNSRLTWLIKQAINPEIFVDAEGVKKK